MWFVRTHALGMGHAWGLLLQGDYYQWVALFNRFDEFFEVYLKPRNDLQLKYTPVDAPFPEENCLAVLSVTSILFEHCSNKHVYASYEVSFVLCCSDQTVEKFVNPNIFAAVSWSFIGCSITRRGGSSPLHTDELSEENPLRKYPLAWVQRPQH